MYEAATSCERTAFFSCKNTNNIFRNSSLYSSEEGVTHPQTVVIVLLDWTAAVSGRRH